MKTEHMSPRCPVLDLFDEIERRVQAHRFTFGDEKALQLSLLQLLNDVAADRELATDGYRIDRQLLGDLAAYREFAVGDCRFDLAIDVIERGSVVGNLVIEVKQDGSAAEWLRQCNRYAGFPVVLGVILITTKSTGYAAIANQSVLNGKPFRAVLARRAAW